MASPSELSLECKPPQSQYSLTVLKPNFGVADNNKSTSNGVPQQQGATAIDGHSSSSTTTTQKLEEYLSLLEEERLKIDAFKRELPLCMQLLSNAMEVSRQQLQSCRSSIIDEKPRPVLEEFIPINKQHSSNPDEDMMTTRISDQNNKTPKNATDKSNWMTSAQLWSNTNIQAVNTKHQQQEQEAKNHHDHQISPSFGPRLTLLDVNMQRNNVDGGNEGGRAFLPFTKVHRHTSSLPNLALTPNGGAEMADDKKLCLNGLSSENGNKGSTMNGGFMVGKPTGEETTTSTNAGGTTTTTTGQTQRKQRRCWSPDLHRRFVSALQMLGGSQVATPKQIRELMKVDGLTNDEVKSHLQKYRLHTRRPGPISPQATGSSAPQLVVLGGIWVPPEYAAHHHAHGGPPTIYSTHPTTQMSPQPSHYPPEFYQPGPPPQTLLHHPQLQIHHHHPHNNHHHIHQLHAYNNIPPPSSRHTQSSPETEERGVSRERSVSTEDDGRSDWKNGGGVIESSSGEERKINTLRRLTSSLREGDHEESNGSEIALNI